MLGLVLPAAQKANQRAHIYTSLALFDSSLSSRGRVWSRQKLAENGLGARGGGGVRRFLAGRTSEGGNVQDWPETLL